MNKHMRKIYNKKGMTLVEVLVAFALLIIIAAAFLLLFSTSLVNIFNFGAESKAIAFTAETMEAVYNISSVSKTSITDKLGDPEDLDGQEIGESELASLYVYDGEHAFNYYIESVITDLTSGYEVTLVAFYRRGEKYVDLTSFVKDGE